MNTLRPCLVALAALLVSTFASTTTANAAEPVSLTALAEQALLAGQYDASTALADEAIRITPNDVKAYLVLALAHDHAGRYEEAADAYRVVARLHQDRYRALLLLGRALTRAGDVATALEVYDAARSLRRTPQVTASTALR